MHALTKHALLYGQECSVCKRTLPADSFYSRKDHDGLLHRQCKECFKTRHYRENPKQKLKAIEWSARQYKALKDDPVKYANHLAKTRNRYRALSLTERRETERRKDPVKKSARQRVRNTKRRGNGGSFTVSEWDSLCEKFGHKCVACEQVRPLTADHIVPVSKGGSSDISNIQPLCGSCNSRKFTKSINYKVIMFR